VASETTTRDSIFCRAIEIASAEERAAFIAGACGDDLELRRGVEKLVAAHFRAGSFLESHDSGMAATVDAPSFAERPGTTIGPYKLLQQIGEGGMGTVFMAEQTRPVQRKVALKVIKPGMDSHQVIARFEAERQALALMDHPNIAKVLDAGTTDSGRPYFVMELVKGVPITRYCDENRLTPKERLGLFIAVCQAVQHAHQKGIIHRDLKPGNVLVALYDGKPVPKVIDFGIAKATGPKLTDRTLFTEFGAVVGTLEYMSPEQAELNQLDIDTRSDVYSLGVLLYELLTGTTPLERKRLTVGALLESLRIIREEEPPKPSTRLSTADELPNIAASRGLEPRKLTGLVRGELDWIVMRALEKDRNRRYESASAFAADVQRYLRDEPVQAGPPSAWYRFRKLARRNRGALTTAVLLAAAVVVTIVVLAISNVLVTRQRDEKDQALTEKDQALKDKQAALEQAEREEQAKDEALKDKERALKQVRNEKDRAQDEERKAKASAEDRQAVIQFFTEKIMGAARPKDQEGGLGVGATIREAVDAAEPQLSTIFRDKPLIEAEIRDTLGTTYALLGERQLAIPQYERSVALLRQHHAPDRSIVEGLHNLAMAQAEAGRRDLALSLMEEALKLSEAKLGADDPDTIAVMTRLGGLYMGARQTNGTSLTVTR
jgi:serine/threonine protein kinase